MSKAGSILQRVGTAAVSADLSIDKESQLAADVTVVAGVDATLATLTFTLASARDVLLTAMLSGQMAGVSVFTAIIRIDGVDTIGGSMTSLAAGQFRSSCCVQHKASLAAGLHTIILRCQGAVGTCVIDAATSPLYASASIAARVIA